MLWLRQQNTMGTVTLMGFTCVARPGGDSALSQAGLHFFSIKGLFSHGPASFLPLLKGFISSFIFSLVKMNHLPLEVGMYHNPEI